MLLRDTPAPVVDNETVKVWVTSCDKESAEFESVWWLESEMVVVTVSDAEISPLDCVALIDADSEVDVDVDVVLDCVMVAELVFDTDFSSDSVSLLVSPPTELLVD